MGRLKHGSNIDRRFKKVDDNISLMPHGSFKVSKRVNGILYQKIFKTVELARAFRDSLIEDNNPNLPLLPNASTTMPVDSSPEKLTSKSRRPYRKREPGSQPKLSSVAMSDLFESNGTYMVIMSKDKNLLTGLIDKMLE